MKSLGKCLLGQEEAVCASLPVHYQPIPAVLAHVINNIMPSLTH